MEFILEEKALTLLANKYNVKKSLIKKAQKKINKTGYVENKKDFLFLVEVVMSTYTIINSQVKEFSKLKDNLIIGISLDYIIEYELKRKYNISMESNNSDCKKSLSKRPTVKKLK